MIKEKAKIATMLSAFHDGTLFFEKPESDYLIFKIECQYLAELIQKGNELFYK